MFNELLVIYINYHIKKDCDFSILFCGVAIRLLSDKYNRAVREGELESIRTLPVEKLRQYNKLGKQYMRENISKQMIMKACYILDFVTQKI